MRGRPRRKPAAECAQSMFAPFAAPSSARYSASRPLSKRSKLRVQGLEALGSVQTERLRSIDMGPAATQHVVCLSCFQALAHSTVTALTRHGHRVNISRMCVVWRIAGPTGQVDFSRCACLRPSIYIKLQSPTPIYQWLALSSPLSLRTYYSNLRPPSIHDAPTCHL